MLSILIPTYNYDTYPLVKRLHKECTELKIPFEIICLDDASEEWYDNMKINSLDYCQFHVQAENTGQSRLRNTLISKSNYDWILFLDSDVFPVNENFIFLYLDTIQTLEPIVISGGLAYQENTPESYQMLRWVYGHNREAISLSKRERNPYDFSLCSNLLIHKTICKNISFQTKINQYGYEDLIYFKELQKRNIPVRHIENPVYHLKLETSEIFLSKTNRSIDTLSFLIDERIIQYEDTKLGKTYLSLKKSKCIVFFHLLFNKFKKSIVKNLLSERPSLFLFDLYKLGLFVQKRK